MVAASLATAGLIVVLVIFYLTRPYFRPQNLSAFRFIERQMATDAADRRFSLRSLLLSRPFYFQVSALTLVLFAFILSQYRVAAQSSAGIALGIALDTSASMTTIQNGVPRSTLAMDEVERLVEELTRLPVDRLICLEAFTFDEERRALGRATPAQLPALLADQTRALATNLSLVRDMAAPVEGSDCPLSHLIVITDQAAPDWIGQTPLESNLIWRDIAQPVANIGLASIVYSQAVQFGGVGDIEVVVAAYGEKPATTTLRITPPSGPPFDQLIDWSRPGADRLRIPLTVSGFYRLDLLPSDAYALDDMALIDVVVPEGVLVDWQLSDRTLPDLLGWRVTTEPADLRVVDYAQDARVLLGRLSDETPTLVVGNAYNRAPTSSSISFFVEDHPLLDDLNFDVAESLAIDGVSLPEETLLDPVLTDSSADNPRDAVWLAVRQSPPAVYIPGLPWLPSGSDTSNDHERNLAAFSLTTFFNGVRWLLQERQPPDLFTRTTPQQPEPEGSRLALHPGEGDTAQPPLSVGDFTDLRPATVSAEREPVWPIIVSLVALIILIERTLAAWGGNAWR